LLCGTALAGIPAKLRKRNTRGTLLRTMATPQDAGPRIPRRAHTAEPVPRSVTVLPERLETGHEREAELPLPPLFNRRQTSRGASRPRQPGKPPPRSRLHSASRRLPNCWRSPFEPAVLALAIARNVRRATFEWAAREAKSPLEAPRSEDLGETNFSESAGDSFERAALLRHFFGRAVESGTLTSRELDLLITFKLEGGAENGAFSNAERQRLKRLLGKLRRLAGGRDRTAR
jgi:hypothetical protein